MKLFISYAREDDEPFCEWLYHQLMANGFEVWWDRATLASRGNSFIQEIQSAIEAANRVLLVVGPDAAASDYVRMEWEYALSLCKVVTPLLRIGRHDGKDSYSLLPAPLANVHCVDFRRERVTEDALKELRRVLNDPEKSPGALIKVPSLPPNFLLRQRPYDQVRHLLIGNLFSPHASANQKVGIVGMGGLGKTVLATAIARNCEIRRAFPDGIYWLNVGSNPSIIQLQSRLATLLDQKPHQFTDTEEGSWYLSNILGGKTCLIVLDDVWDAANLKDFDFMEGTNRLLFTTRDASIASGVRAALYPLEGLNDVEALALLAETSGISFSDLPSIAHRIPRECGNLPLALALVGSMARTGHHWADLLTALQKADLEFFAIPGSNYQYQSVLQTIEVSIDLLPADLQSRFLDLAVFPPDALIPEGVILTLWQHQLGSDAGYRLRSILPQLQAKSLLIRNADGTLVLHDLIVDYLHLRMKNDLPRLHNILLNAYNPLKAAWHTLPDDAYLDIHLAEHLMCAGHRDELIHLLTDTPHWMQRVTAPVYIQSVNMALAEFREPFSALDFQQMLYLLMARKLIERRFQQFSDEAVSVMLALKRYEQALSEVRLRAEPEKRFNGLALIYTALRENHAEKAAVLEELATTAEQIKEPAQQIAAYAQLFAFTHQDDYQEKVIALLASASSNDVVINALFQVEAWSQAHHLINQERHSVSLIPVLTNSLIQQGKFDEALTFAGEFEETAYQQRAIYGDTTALHYIKTPALHLDTQIYLGGAMPYLSKSLVESYEADLRTLAETPEYLDMLFKLATTLAINGQQARASTLLQQGYEKIRLLNDETLLVEWVETLAILDMKDLLPAELLVRQRSLQQEIDWLLKPDDLITPARQIAKQLSANHPDDYHRLARMLVDVQQTETAVELYEQGLAFSTQQRDYRAWRNLKRHFAIALSEMEPGETVLAKVSQLDVQDFELLPALKILVEQGQIEAAIAFYEAKKKLVSGRAFLYILVQSGSETALAWVQQQVSERDIEFALEQHDEATAFKLAKLKPVPEHYIPIIWRYLSLGRVDEAVTLYLEYPYRIIPKKGERHFLLEQRLAQETIKRCPLETIINLIGNYSKDSYYFQLPNVIYWFTLLLEVYPYSQVQQAVAASGIDFKDIMLVCAFKYHDTNAPDLLADFLRQRHYSTTRLIQYARHLHHDLLYQLPVDKIDLKALVEEFDVEEHPALFEYFAAAHQDVQQLIVVLLQQGYVDFGVEALSRWANPSSFSPQTHHAILKHLVEHGYHQRALAYYQSYLPEEVPVNFLPILMKHQPQQAKEYWYQHWQAKKQSELLEQLDEANSDLLENITLDLQEIPVKSVLYSLNTALRESKLRLGLFLLKWLEKPGMEEALAANQGQLAELAQAVEASPVELQKAIADFLYQYWQRDLTQDRSIIPVYRLFARCGYLAEAATYVSRLSSLKAIEDRAEALLVEVLLRQGDLIAAAQYQNRQKQVWLYTLGAIGQIEAGISALETLSIRNYDSLLGAFILGIVEQSAPDQAWQVLQSLTPPSKPVAFFYEWKPNIAARNFIWNYLQGELQLAGMVFYCERTRNNPNQLALAQSIPDIRSREAALAAVTSREMSLEELETLIHQMTIPTYRDEVISKLIRRLSSAYTKLSKTAKQRMYHWYQQIETEAGRKDAAYSLLRHLDMEMLTQLTHQNLLPRRAALAAQIKFLVEHNSWEEALQLVKHLPAEEMPEDVGVLVEGLIMAGYPDKAFEITALTASRIQSSCISILARHLLSDSFVNQIQTLALENPRTDALEPLFRYWMVQGSLKDAAMFIEHMPAHRRIDALIEWTCFALQQGQVGAALQMLQKENDESIITIVSRWSQAYTTVFADVPPYRWLLEHLLTILSWGDDGWLELKEYL